MESKLVIPVADISENCSCSAVLKSVPLPIDIVDTGSGYSASIDVTIDGVDYEISLDMTVENKQIFGTITFLNKKNDKTSEFYLDPQATLYPDLAYHEWDDIKFSGFKNTISLVLSK